MTTVMMKLGGYNFSLSNAAYQQLQKSTEYRWTAQQRLGNHNAMQYTGQGNQQIELEGVIYPHYKGGIKQLVTMQAEADKHKPLILVDSTGKVWGSYIITNIAETHSLFAKDGTAKKIGFHLTLTAYGDNHALQN